MMGRKAKTTEPEELVEKRVILRPDMIRPGSFKENKRQNVDVSLAKIAKIQKIEDEKNAELEWVEEVRRQTEARKIEEDRRIEEQKQKKKEEKRLAKAAKIAAKKAEEDAMKVVDEPEVKTEEEHSPIGSNMLSSEALSKTKISIKKALVSLISFTVKVPKRISSLKATTWIIGAYTFLLVGAQITLMYQTKLGLFINVLSLLVLILFALLREDIRKLSISLAILPVTLMVNSSFSIGNAFIRVTVFYGVLLLLALIYRYMFTLEFPFEKSRLKLKGHVFGIPLMLTLGEIVGLIGYVFMRNRYPYQHITLPLVAAACIVFAFAEEMFLRGLVQKQAAQIFHPLVAAGFTAIIYSTLAINHTSMLTVGPAVAMGVVLSLVYYSKQNLLLSTVVNAAAKLTYVGLVAAFVLR
jgi:membrane protease YdiL (CAAX protease family)